MSVLPTDALALAVVNLKVLTADSATFQAMVHTGGLVAATDTTFTAAVAAVQADRSIYRSAAQQQIKPLWLRPTLAKPRALVGYERDAYHNSGGKAWSCENVLRLYFEFNTPTALQGDANEEDACIDFLNKVGAIRREMMELAGTGTAPSPSPANRTYMKFHEINLMDIGQADKDDNNAEDFWAAFFYVGWTGSIQLQA